MALKWRMMMTATMMMKMMRTPFRPSTPSLSSWEEILEPNKWGWVQPTRTWWRRPKASANCSLLIIPICIESRAWRGLQIWFQRIFTTSSIFVRPFICQYHDNISHLVDKIKWQWWRVLTTTTLPETQRRPNSHVLFPDKRFWIFYAVSLSFPMQS